MTAFVEGSICSRTPQAVAAVLRSAEAACRERGVLFTAIRRSVLESLWQSAQPMGAYELMGVVKSKLGRKLSPPTIYRALDFLLEQGLISRIESRNAFVPCAHPERDHACVYFICDACGSSLEIENSRLEALVEQEAASLGFRIGRSVIEMQGTCAHCLSSATGSA